MPEILTICAPQAFAYSLLDKLVTPVISQIQITVVARYGLGVFPRTNQLKRMIKDKNYDVEHFTFNTKQSPLSVTELISIVFGFLLLLYLYLSPQLFYFEIL